MIVVTVIIILVIFAALSLILICSEPRDDHYTIEELPYIGSPYNDDEVITYKMYHCNKCRCYDASTGECHNTAHWGKYCSKTINHCVHLGSFERNKIENDSTK